MGLGPAQGPTDQGGSRPGGDRMDYRTLGRSGLKVSPLCLGAMMFGGPTSEADSREIVAAARDAGVNFIDTADAYNGGESERVVGRAIAADRDRWVLATTLAHKLGDDPNSGGLSRPWVPMACDASPKRPGPETGRASWRGRGGHA